MTIKNLEKEQSEILRKMEKSSGAKWIELNDRLKEIERQMDILAITGDKNLGGLYGYKF